jgi:hypothetical protein
MLEITLSEDSWTNPLALHHSSIAATTTALAQLGYRRGHSNQGDRHFSIDLFKNKKNQQVNLFPAFEDWILDILNPQSYQSTNTTHHLLIHLSTHPKLFFSNSENLNHSNDMLDKHSFLTELAIKLLLLLR